MTRIPLLLALLAATPLPAAPPRLELKDGDRVVLLGNTLIERAQRYGHLETALVARYSDRKLTFRNLGWSGDTVWAESRGLFDPPAKGYQRMLDHVKRLQPTVLLLGYGGNESFAGEKGLKKFLAQYQKLVTDLTARSASRVRVVILSIPPQQEPGLPRVATGTRARGREGDGKPSPRRPANPRSPLAVPAARNRQVELYNAAISRFARSHGHDDIRLSIPFDVRWNHPERRYELSFTEDGRTLNETGYRLIAETVVSQLIVRKFLGTETTVRINRSGTAVIDGILAIGKVTYKPPRLSFAIRHPSAEVLLRVLGLPPGQYDVRVDERTVLRYKAEDLAEGLVLDPAAPPSIEPLRQAIIDKNRLYFHRWRPQNTTYLFGFRKHEQGQNAREVAEFEKLVAAKEDQIDRLKQKVVRRFEIVRVKKK